MTFRTQTPVVADTNVVSYIYREEPIASRYIQRPTAGRQSEEGRELSVADA